MPRRMHLRYNILTTLAFLFFVPLYFQAVKGQQITKRVGIVFLYPYQPRDVSAIDQLPTEIQGKLKDHLTSRLGQEFFSKLKFSYGSIVDFDELYKINPGARGYKWRIFAYKIGFVFTDLGRGIKKYEAEVWLDRDGEVVREIDLPAIGKFSEKGRLISVKEAKKISKSQKFNQETIELIFREKDDSIAWRMVRHSRDGTTRCLDISAHNGEILEKFGMKGIHN